MFYRQGERHNIPRLRCIKISSYMFRDHYGNETLLHRYGFKQEHGLLKFSYTGQVQPIKEGDTVDIRGTIKREANSFGYIQLSRIRLIDMPQQELNL